MSRMLNYGSAAQILALQMLQCDQILRGGACDVVGDFEIGDDEIVGDPLDDVLGDDEIMGAILGYDVLGAAAPAAPAKAALARAIAARNGRVVKKRAATGAQEQVLGFERATVTALTEATVRAFPQRMFRTERFAIAASVANFFDVLDLRIGRDSMFVDVGPVPAETFSQVGVGVTLRGYTANLGNTITLQVENIDAGDQMIRASIIGTAITR